MRAWLALQCDQNVVHIVVVMAGNGMSSFSLAH